MPERLSFSEEPKSELERSLSELMEHAQRVLHTESRLRGLLRAYRAVMVSLDIDEVLRRVTGAAATLVSARDAAVAIFDERGNAERVLRMDDPEGTGLAENLDREDLVPLTRLERDPRRAGVTLASDSVFLGIPIRSHGDAYGALYLVGRPGAAFTREDEELVEALAATAGIAMENARLYEQSRRRLRWSAALTEVSSALLSGDASDVVGVVVARVSTVVAADIISVVVPDPDSDQLLVHTARGDGAERFEGRRYSREGSVVDRALRSGKVMLAPVSAASVALEAEMGPNMVLPVIVAGEAVCALTLTRSRGSSLFTAADVDMAAEFASQVGVAIELTRARADRQRLELVDEKGRIARDLHDHVIQRLFGTGLSLQALAARFPDAEQDLLEQADAVDEAIDEIRTAVFALTTRGRAAAATTRQRILTVVSEMSASLPTIPRLTFSGPVDLLVTEGLADDVLAVVRECLANTARHASARIATVDVVVDEDHVEVLVTDDGIGVPAVITRRSGTANLAERAQRRGGTFILAPGDAGGTRAVWRAGLPDERTQS